MHACARVRVGVRERHRLEFLSASDVVPRHLWSAHSAAGEIDARVCARTCTLCWYEAGGDFGSPTSHPKKPGLLTAVRNFNESMRCNICFEDHANMARTETRAFTTYTCSQSSI